jgi:hypothetical protein
MRISSKIDDRNRQSLHHGLKRYYPLLLLPTKKRKYERRAPKEALPPVVEADPNEKKGFRDDSQSRPPPEEHR